MRLILCPPDDDRIGSFSRREKVEQCFSHHPGATEYVVPEFQVTLGLLIRVDWLVGLDPDA